MSPKIHGLEIKTYQVWGCFQVRLPTAPLPLRILLVGNLLRNAPIVRLLLDSVATARLCLTGSCTTP